MEDGRWKMEDGKMEDGRWKMEDGRWKMEDGRWKMEDGRGKMKNAKCNLLIDNMNDRLKNLSTESAEGTEIHRILTVWLENRLGMLDYQIF